MKIELTKEECWVLGEIVNHASSCVDRDTVSVSFRPDLLTEKQWRDLAYKLYQPYGLGSPKKS